jgi:transposase-like protein
MLKRGVSQAEVARRLEVSRQSVNRWAQLLEQANGGVSEFLCVRLVSTLPASGEGRPVPASRFPIVTQHSR